MVWEFCVYFVYMIPLETDVLRKHRFQQLSLSYYTLYLEVWNNESKTIFYLCPHNVLLFGNTENKTVLLKYNLQATLLRPKIYHLQSLGIRKLFRVITTYLCMCPIENCFRCLDVLVKICLI